MKNRAIGLVVASALAVTTMGGSASAAELKPNQAGFSCPVGFIAVLEFLNNQVPKDTGVGEYSVRLDSPTGAVVVQGGVIADNGKKVRRFVAGPAGHPNSTTTLTSASTTLPGKLVLVSAECVLFTEP